MNLENAKITILFSDGGMSIDVVDANACITFLKARLSPSEACDALSRLCLVHCECDVANLDLVGKRMVHKQIEFEIPILPWDKRESGACECAKKECPYGWFPDLYFGAQDSFFVENGKEMARCTIRRWE